MGIKQVFITVKLKYFYMRIGMLLFLFFISSLGYVKAQQSNVIRTSDVIYDHKDGMAFVLDVIRPARQNGAAILYILSGGWVSREASTISTRSYKSYTDKGYTVFIISHGSQPRYNVPEILQQVQRAIRFIRFNARVYGVDPARFGVIGHSAGGHLSVSAAVFGEEALTAEEYRRTHNIPAKEKIDSINLASDKVQAVACFYPPTNFINYLNADSNWFDFPKVRNVSANGSFIATPDSTRRFQDSVLNTFSPYFHISYKTPPVLIIHGAQDGLVPYSQSVSLVAKLNEYHVPNKLITKPDKDHGWPHDPADEAAVLAWFDKYLLK